MSAASSQKPRGNDAEEGHDERLAQPRSDLEDPEAEAEAVAESIRSPDEPLGRPGEPLNRRSPFFIGMTAAAGVAVTVGVVKLVLIAVTLSS
jgi:hypothetical protein